MFTRHQKSTSSFFIFFFEWCVARLRLIFGAEEWHPPPRNCRRRYKFVNVDF